MATRSGRRCSAAVAVVAVLAILAASCSTSSSKSSSPTTAGSSGSSKFTASARGVTADTIKIGLSFPDLAALAKTGLLKVDNGDYEAIGKALVDDVNAHGGVNGRKLQLFIGKYSVLSNDDQLAACTKLTEDDQVFAVLGGFLGDNNLCITQQHSTTLVSGYGAGFNQISLAKARAPWATWNASDERSLDAMVKILDQQGTLKGRTIGVYSIVAASKPLVDRTVSDLKAAGYSVKDTAINDVPAGDPQSFNAQDHVIGERFKNEGINSVIVLVTVPPGTNWDNIGYHPEMYSPQTSLVTSGAITNHYEKFPLVAGIAASADLNAGYDTPTMQHCRAVWKQATGKEIKPYTEEQKEGKSSGFNAMSTTCAALQIFVDAAKAAGPNLNTQTWQKGLESIGQIALPAAPVSSFGPNKPDGQDSFQLMKFNPVWKFGSSAPELIAVGAPITFTG